MEKSAAQRDAKSLRKFGCIIRLRLGLLLQLDNVFGGDRPASIKRIILLGQLIVQLPPPVQENKPTVLKLLVDFLGYYDFKEWAAIWVPVLLFVLVFVLCSPRKWPKN